MALSYNFANICGAPFEGGRIAFTPDGSGLAAPCGNRVTVYDLRHNRVTTLPFEARQNVKHLIFTPTDPLLLSIDESGRCLVVNFVKGIILSRFWFRRPVSDAKISPCGKYFVVAIDRKLRLWDSPTAEKGWQLSLRREIQQHADRIISVNWSRDSQFLCTASQDLTVRLFSRDPIEGFKPITFVDHRYPLRAAFFSWDMTRIFSVSRDGVMISWKWIATDDDDDTDSEKRGFHLGQFGNNAKGSSLDVQRRLHQKRVCIMGDEDVKMECDNIESTLNLQNATLNTSLLESMNSPTYICGQWVLEKKLFCSQASGSLVVRCELHGPNGLLVIGFSNGVISLYSCPEFEALYTLSVGTEALDSITINADGEWLAMGSSQLGQLVVWEWRSETYILKQQNHNTGIRCVACSPALDAVSQARRGGEQNTLGLSQRNLIVATGGEDGKLKLWDTASGFNFMTFSEHLAPINDVIFTPQGNAVISASQDGSVRAFDLARYRNFRTYTAPTNGVQFVCIGVDGGGEIIVAGSQGTEYSVFVWSIQTGKLLEILTGHTSCISSVQFHPHPSKPGVLISGSWDSTIRVWDIFGRTGKGGNSEPLINSTGVLAAAFDPRGNNQLAAATYSGNIWFWDIQEGTLLGSIDGLRDIRSGRRIGDLFSANNTRGVTHRNKKNGSVGAGVNQNQHFNSVTYSSNGTWLLAASKTSARVCVYCTDRRHLLHAVQLTTNVSLDGILIELNSKFMTEAGISKQGLDVSDSEGDEDEVIRKRKQIQQHMSLPGTNVGELKSRKGHREFHVWQLAFSQDGQQWCAATSHGLFTYCAEAKGGTVASKSSSYMSQTHLERFCPNIITRNVTIQNIMDALKSQPSQAMILALALNDFFLLTRVYTSIRYDDVGIVVQSIPPLLIPALMNFLRVCFSDVVNSREMMKKISLKKGLNVNQIQPVGGTPHLQYHLRWLTCLLSSRLATLQHIDPTRLYTNQSAREMNDDIKMEPQDSEKKIQLMGDFGVSNADLRTLCLFLLRNVQRVHASLCTSFGSNLRTLDYLLTTTQHRNKGRAF